MSTISGHSDGTHHSLFALLQGSREAFCALDRELCVLFVNREAERIMGASRSDLLGKPIGDVSSVDVGEFRRALKEDTVVEFRHFCSASKTWVELRACPSETGLAINFHDLGAAVGQQDDHHRRLFERIAQTTPDILYIYDVNAGRNIYANRSSAELLGYTEEQMSSLNISQFEELVHPDDRHLTLAARQKFLTLHDGEVYEYEYRLRRADGSWRWLRVRDVVFARGVTGRPSQILGLAQDVTTHKRLEDERRRSEELTQHIVEHSPIAILVADTEGRMIHVNDAWLKTLGYTRQDVMEGRVNWKELTAPEHRDLDLQAIEEVRKNGSHAPFEKTLIRKDGVRVPCLAATAYLGGPGEIGVGFLVDLTEVKRAQETIQHSEERLRQALDAGSCGIYEWDIVNDRVTWTDRLYDFFGIRPEEFDGTSAAYAARLHPDDRDLVWGSVKRALEHDTPHRMEYRLIRPNGEIRWIFTNSGVIRDSSGKPLRLLGACIDVTDRKLADEALRRSEDKYRTLTDAVGSLMWMSDANGQMVFFNGRFAEYIAGDAKRILGLGWKQLVHPDDIGEVIRERTAAIAEKREYRVEYRLRRHDGQYRWHLTRIVPHKDSSGNIINWFGTATDIHDLKLAEEAVKHAKAEAEQANAAKDHFLAVLSHELRTPLTPVVMTVAAMEMDRSLSPQVRDDLAMIRRNIELETKLIDDLLDVTRIANGKLRLQPRPTDVHTLVRNVMEILRSDITEKQLRVTPELSAQDAQVSADPARLQQIFWNLVKNAIKFTPTGGTITIRTSNLCEKSVRVEVIDSGAGIDPEALPRIFNAFDQGEQSVTRQFGGLGLGLAISKALTDLHGGTIRAHSDGKGKGAVFSVELPTLGAITRLVDQIQPIPSNHQGQRVRVLLVEDHLDTQKTLRRLLEDRGYQVSVAGSVAAALAVLAAEPIDVVVSDIGLPDSTGHELMRQVAKLHALPGVALSGFGMDADIRHSQEAGFAAHLTKPVDLAQLDSLIRSLTSTAREAAPDPIA